MSTVFKFILIGATIMVSALTSHASENCITHINFTINDEKNLDRQSSRTVEAFDLEPYRQALIAKHAAGSTILPLKDELELLSELAEFELGRFLLENRGLNGFWTSYIISEGHGKKDFSPLEKWILESAPTTLATRDRFHIFQRHLQNCVSYEQSQIQPRYDIKNIASIPCGAMDDLLTLDCQNLHNLRFIGIDLDERSLEFAAANAQARNIKNAMFVKRNAWDLGYDEQLDVITSNGLNIYESDDTKVVELYKQFNRALKQDSTLITSFLTPMHDKMGQPIWWNYNTRVMLKQRALFADIIDVKWQVYRSETLVRSQLEAAGFQVMDVIYDYQKMFPTIIANKVHKVKDARS